MRLAGWNDLAKGQTCDARYDPLCTPREGPFPLVRLFALPPRPTMKSPPANHIHAGLPRPSNESITNPNTAHGNLVHPGGQVPSADRVSDTSPA